MGFFTIFRIVMLALSVTFSVIVAGLSADLISLTEEYYNLYFTFAALGIATAGLTIFTIPVMLMVDFIRRGAFTSMILVELIWFFILWVLWVATAGEAVTAANTYFPQGCIYADYPLVNQACHEIQAVEAFSFLAFFVLLGYTIVLLVFACIAASRGNLPWFSSVKETSFLAPASMAPPTQAMGQYPGAQPQYTAPVQPQYSPVSPQTQPYYSPHPGQPQSIPV
ncbi:hypothetical protein SCLCIDRAFT_12726 [Scleroderma citrinum Foug A]|uniref:MARVEL domain-containing protein n=1 Tax=Scleroderma citrinum Foug A TaxID=1036808 RepID=A0A0C3EQT3_9AGAM|nr:hypothetical protein SCLCIDRAFT_12726 [Scleroderma citrinum Foug A]